MSVRYGTRVGKSSWVSMGPIGWLIVVFLGICVGLVVLFWPVAAMVGIFGQNVLTLALGWVFTVVWWAVLIAGAAIRHKERTDV